MDPQPPAQTPPPEPTQPTGWTPPSQPPSVQPMAPPAERPTTVTVAGILLIIIGALVTLLGVLFVLAGAFIRGAGDAAFSGQFAGLPEAAGSFVIVFGLIFGGFGLGEVFTGIYVLPGRAWARISAIVLSVLGGLFSLGGVVGGNSGRGAIVFPLAFLVAYVFIIWAVAANGRWFARG